MGVFDPGRNMADEQPRAWQRMLSGRRLDLLDPSPLDIEIEDIAHGLARVARWNGQTKGEHAFSVAQHCVLVERITTELNPRLTREARLMALLHDAPEYVIGDLISPFKVAIGIDYKALELKLQSAIHVRFGLAAQDSGDARNRLQEGRSDLRLFRGNPACWLRSGGCPALLRRPAKGQYTPPAGAARHRRGTGAVPGAVQASVDIAFLLSPSSAS